MPAQQDHDALTAKIAPIRTAIEEAVAKALQDEKSALAPLWGEIEDYFDGLLAEADKVWKLKVLSEAKERALKLKNGLDGPNVEALDVAAHVLNEVESALGWIVPRPVDPDVVAAVVARDRAADMAERAAKGIGIKK